MLAGLRGLDKHPERACGIEVVVLHEDSLEVAQWELSLISTVSAPPQKTDLQGQSIADRSRCAQMRRSRPRRRSPATHGLGDPDIARAVRPHGMMIINVFWREHQ